MDKRFLDARELYAIVWWEWFGEVFADIGNFIMDMSERRAA